jgi:hypothetical protein
MAKRRTSITFSWRKRKKERKEEGRRKKEDFQTIPPSLIHCYLFLLVPRPIESTEATVLPLLRSSLFTPCRPRRRLRLRTAAGDTPPIPFSELYTPVRTYLM